MSVSTDAILAYGHDLGELDAIYELELDWLKDADDPGEALDDRLLAELAGFTEEWSETNNARAGYFKRKDAAADATGVEVITHCSLDAPMYFLAARGSGVTASRGYPQKVLSPLVADPRWDERIARAVAALGLVLPDPPAWHLFSLWG